MVDLQRAISRRKFVYPFFAVSLGIVVFVLFYMFLFSQALAVTESEVSVAGERVNLRVVVKNTSNHIVEDPTVLVIMGEGQIEEKLKPQDNFLIPGESYEKLLALPISSTLFYDAYILAPFNRSIRLPFEIDASTIEPVKAEVVMPSLLKVGVKSDVIVKLCNVSKSDLHEVFWIESVEGDYFEEKFFPRSTSLSVGECKNLYSSLTPVSAGEARFTFTLRVGTLEQKIAHKVSIEE